jgi:hypothetical protein
MPGRAELSHMLLASVAGHKPPRELEQRFALDVLAALPDDGFVLELNAIWWCLQEAARPTVLLSAGSDSVSAPGFTLPDARNWRHLDRWIRRS